MDDYFDELADDLLAVTRWVGAVVVLLVALAWASVAIAAPRAHSPEECRVAADMAIVARALAAESLERSRAETIMRRIYDVSDSERGQALLGSILAAAYQNGESADAFATKLLVTCMRTGGNIDGVLGTSL